MAENLNRLPSDSTPVWMHRRQSGRRTTVTALDLDGGVVRVAQAVRRGKQVVITSFATRKLERPIQFSSGSAKANGETIAGILKDLNVKAGPVIMGIPRGLVMLRPLAMPVTDTLAELASMVQFQMSKDLPFPPEEAVIDFKVQRLLSTPRPVEDSAGAAKKAEGGKEGAARVAVMVAVVKKEVVEQYQQMAAAAGIKLISLGLASYANARCVSQCHAGNGSQAEALVSLRSGEVIVDVVADHSLAFSRMSVLAPAELNPAEKPGNNTPAGIAPGNGDHLIEGVTIEVLRSLHGYEGLEDKRPVANILVAGDSGQETAVVKALAKRFSIPCAIHDPASALGLDPATHPLTSGASTVFGLALAGLDEEGLPLDFLNPKRPPIPHNWRRIKLITAAASILVLGLTTFGVRAHLLHKKWIIRDQLQAQVAQAKKNQPVFRDLRQKVKIVKDWQAEKHDWLDHYAYLSAILPPCNQIYVTSLSTGARGTIHLSVQARSGEILARMDKRLREAGYVLKPLATTPSSDRYGYNFQTTVELILSSQIKVDKTNLSVAARPEDDGSLDPPESRSAEFRNRPALASAPAPAAETPPARVKKNNGPSAPQPNAPAIVFQAAPVQIATPSVADGSFPSGKRGRGMRSDTPGDYSGFGRGDGTGRRGRKVQQP